MRTSRRDPTDGHFNRDDVGEMVPESAALFFAASLAMTKLCPTGTSPTGLK